MSFAVLPWACLQCGTRADTDARCPSCAADAMMDLRDPGVRAELLKEDEERRGKRRQVMIWVALPAAILTATLLGLGVVGLFVGAAAGYGLSLALASMFPAPQLFPYARD
ncbi:MAG: hypothetical protein AB1938_05220 [Myxococcota bacterium]